MYNVQSLYRAWEIANSEPIKANSKIRIVNCK